jgi:hypothetical protein
MDPPSDGSMQCNATESARFCYAAYLNFEREALYTGHNGRERGRVERRLPPQEAIRRLPCGAASGAG